MKEEYKYQLPKKENFSEWYDEVLKKADLIDKRYGVKGFYVHKPWCMFIFRGIYDLYETALESTGHMPTMFPLVIPEDEFKKEADHIKGFEEEVFWITHAGSKKLDKKLVLRPTSETAMHPMYSLWIRSYKDLPLKLYQSGAVYRYETEATKALLRGREFLWIEAHDAFSTLEGARRQVREDKDIAEDIVHQLLGIPFKFFRRPAWDRFPGAVESFALETVMPDQKILQIGTTHLLGQKFSKMFDIKYLNEDGEEKYVWQTCYGPGIWRLLASVVSIHGDDYGLVLPPAVSPIQVVIVPILGEGEDEKVIEKCSEVGQELQRLGIRTKVDLSEESVGEKYYYWEMKGIPVRLEIGPRELEKEKVTLFRRDTRKRKEMTEGSLYAKISDILERVLDNLKSKADRRLEESVGEAKNFKGLKRKLEDYALVRVPFCSLDFDGETCAEKIKEELQADIRGELVREKKKPTGNCVVCGQKAKHLVYIARSY